MTNHSNAKIDIDIRPLSFEDWFIKLDQECKDYEAEAWCRGILRSITQEAYHPEGESARIEFDEIQSRYHAYREDLRSMWLN